MRTRRVLPPRPELSPERRAELVATMKARRERVEAPEERAAFLASLEAVMNGASAKQLRWAHTSNFFHLGAYFKPSD